MIHYQKLKTLLFLTNKGYIRYIHYILYCHYAQHKIFIFSLYNKKDLNLSLKSLLHGHYFNFIYRD